MNESSNPFVEALHRSFALPRPEIESLVVRATGRPARTVERVVDGYDNEVYRAETGAEVVFVRIKRFGEDATFDGELWAMHTARSVGVPVPEAILVVEVNTDDGVASAMVLAAAPGTAINSLADPSSTDRATALQNAGKVLARLHSAAAPGFWRPAADGTWPIRTWHTLMDGFIADRVSELDVMRSIGFTGIGVDRMLALMQSYQDDFPCPIPVLCRGDFTPDHVFVDVDLAVTGVIDFGMYSGGPPTGDLAMLNFNLTLDDVDAILAGYDCRDPTFRRAIDLHTVGLAIGHLAHHARIGDTRTIHEGAAALRATMRRL